MLTLILTQRREGAKGDASEKREAGSEEREGWLADFCGLGILVWGQTCYAVRLAFSGLPECGGAIIAERLRRRLPRPQTFDAWIAHRDYRFLWVGNFFANTAHWLQLLTLGWLVRDLTVDSEWSALLVVGISGISTLPGIVIGPLGGVLGDRVDRRRLIMSLQAFMMCLSFAFACVIAFDLVEVWHVFAYAIISGACLSITQPMRQALIANTVAPHMLGNAYATNVLTIPGTRAIGPFVGGFLIFNLGFFWNFTMEALLYLGMILAYLPMRTPYAAPRRRRADGEQPASSRTWQRAYATFGRATACCSC